MLTPSVVRRMPPPFFAIRRMKRRWRVVLLRAEGEILGDVEAPDAPAAKVAAVARFDLDEVQRTRIIVQEYG
jgi:hypothetical protein